MAAIRRRIALYLFCAVIALAPVPFGSVDEIVVAFWTLLLGVTTLLVIPFAENVRRIAVQVLNCLQLTGTADGVDAP